ncbi:MAG: 6-carboxytetrahydropterin synthase QueD [Deltaproteobacteria bacterium RIFCSPLOWO2_02_FULL_53_8]|nr:MAG: 6-carboxytetrahydropterin synthase QueD [Deltaproteobacteria bacterium RIFCSPLOWO2_02_FULL_53_8]
MYELTIDATFSSAHNLREYEGACENLHGHNWRVEVSVSASKLDALGMVIDFKKLKTETKAVLDNLDHTYLNVVPPFDRINPTAENISQHIYRCLSAVLNNSVVKVSKVQVWESANSSATYHEGHEG